MNNLQKYQFKLQKAKVEAFNDGVTPGELICALECSKLDIYFDLRKFAESQQASKIVSASILPVEGIDG